MRLRQPAVLIGLAVVLALAAAVIAVLLRSGPEEPAAAPPSSAPPAAVLLIPGYGGDPTPLDPLRTELVADGYQVAVLDIGTGTEDIRDYAAAATRESRALRAAGAPSVSTVGFSMGGLVGRVAADEGPEVFDEVISLASPHEGTLLALLGGSGCPLACQQMQPGSELLTGLPEAPDADQWLAIYSTTDGTILPAQSSALPGATVVAIQDICPSATVRHGGVPSHPLVIEAVRAALADEPLPTTCPSTP